MDRRFGEYDATLTAEEKAMERFAREKQRHFKKSSLFDLEEADEGGLTHLGKSLSLNDEAMRDDFDEPDLASDDDFSHVNTSRLKRMRGEDGPDDDEAGGQGDMPERKKSKQEVMKEVIAKSKLHKYERQAAKDDDDDMRKEIDDEMDDLRQILAALPTDQTKNKPPLGQSIAGIDKVAFEKAYDVGIKQMLQDKRAQPSERTKTEEELAEEEAERLKELEEKRVTRMLGGEDSDEGYDNVIEPAHSRALVNGDLEDGDFGLGGGIKRRPLATELGLDDEDDFVIDDDLVASASDLDMDDDEDFEELSELDGETGNGEEEEYDDDEFTKGLLTEAEGSDPRFLADGKDGESSTVAAVPYTFPCPQSHGEWLEIVRDISIPQLPTVVQRIRALYHPKLDSRNKERLGNFARVLVRHVAHLGDLLEADALSTLETLIRHIHSLAKMFPIEVAREFRQHLQHMESLRPLDLTTGDLVILTAVGTIFPTSDHFHQVVTPATLAMARYLGQKLPQNMGDFAVGTYLSILFIQHQQLSKRYVPELMSFCVNTLASLSPVRYRQTLGGIPLHPPVQSLRIEKAQNVGIRKLRFGDCASSESSAYDPASTGVAIISTTVAVLLAAAETWTGKAAFFESFEPASRMLKHLAGEACRSHLPTALGQEIDRASGAMERMLQVAHLSRRPLELHHHRPLAIQTRIPKFEETFDPDKHYDPNRERAETAKLRAEHRKERKGAMRELRKDAGFMAREKLRIKKVKDEAYDKKFKRLVAEIQGEEGQGANEYEREKKARKTARHR